jgi:hypothetical protein
MQKSKGLIISFMGIKPKEPGEFWTSNRHDCSGQSQVRITINPEGSFETFCPCCGANPIVFYEAGQFNYNGNVIFSGVEDG